MILTKKRLRKYMDEELKVNIYLDETQIWVDIPVCDYTSFIRKALKNITKRIDTLEEKKD